MRNVETGSGGGPQTPPSAADGVVRSATMCAGPAAIGNPACLASADLAIRLVTTAAVRQKLLVRWTRLLVGVPDIAQRQAPKSSTSLVRRDPPWPPSTCVPMEKPDGSCNFARAIARTLSVWAAAAGATRIVTVSPSS